jgi:cysteine desulfuration protein SufE
MTINEKQDEILESFAMLEDWADRYEYIIEMGKELDLIDDSLKDDEHLIIGCQSRVWLAAEFDGEFLNLKADSDAIITSGIIAMLLKILSHQTPKDILEADLYFLSDLGLQEHLSMTRSNGLKSMLEKIKDYARFYLDK